MNFIPMMITSIISVFLINTTLHYFIWLIHQTFFIEWLKSNFDGNLIIFLNKTFQYLVLIKKSLSVLTLSYGLYKIRTEKFYTRNKLSKDFDSNWKNFNLFIWIWNRKLLWKHFWSKIKKSSNFFVTTSNFWTKIFIINKAFQAT